MTPVALPGVLCQGMYHSRGEPIALWNEPRPGKLIRVQTSAKGFIGFSRQTLGARLASI